ncbi:MAG: PEP-CTERM sorting domain-containing protein [Planctomycetota bacterium]
MRNLVLIAVLGALLAMPALAGPTPPPDRVVAAPSGPVAGTSGTPRDLPPTPFAYKWTDVNGYYQQLNVSPTLLEVWAGELAITTSPGGNWLMDGFEVGWSMPNAAPATANMHIDFFADDGYYPNAGNYIGGFIIPVVNDMLPQYNLAGFTLATPMLMPTKSVWATYSFSDTENLVHVNGYGPIHVDDDGYSGNIGVDYFDDGWISAEDVVAPIDSTYYGAAGWPGQVTQYPWWYYGGPPNPNADLYLALTPEPTTLVFLAMGGFALIRRRR